MNKLGIHVANAMFRNMPAFYSINWQSFFVLHLNRAQVQPIRSKYPDARIIVRAYTENWFAEDPVKWADSIAGWAGELQQYNIELTFANEQNLSYEGHPLGAPYNGTPYPPQKLYEDIRDWDLAVIKELRVKVPWAKIHFPALSQGHSDDENDAGYVGFEILRPAVDACDILDVHTYWEAAGIINGIDAGVDSPYYGQRYDKVHALFPSKPIYISEWNAHLPDAPIAETQLTHWLDTIANKDYILGCSLFIWDSDSANVMWAIQDKPKIVDAFINYRPTTPPPPPVMATGIDTSMWQGDMDWAVAKAKGISFAFIKATEGQIQDPQFARNWQGAKAQGILRGAYHYFRNYLDPLSQAKNLLDTVGQDLGELPLVVDVEDTSSVADPDKLLAFCKAIGKHMLLYTGKWYWDGNYWTKTFTWTGDTDLWVAGDSLPSDWTTWKFKQTGQAPGADYGAKSALIDLDIFNGTVQELKAYAVPPPIPVPTPTNTVPADPRLAAYPRPADDNSRGIHFGQDMRDSALDNYFPLLTKMGIKWVLIYPTAPDQTYRFAVRAKAAGIMPVVRPKVLISRGYTIGWVDHVKSMQNAGFPNPYIQIFNEPSDYREWPNGVVPADYITKWVNEWSVYAKIIKDAGGLPGVQCLDAEKELRTLLQSADKTLWDKGWFCGHPYPWNHPPKYPFDKLTDAQIAALTEDEIVAATNKMDVSILTHYAFRREFQTALGYVPPFIQGEGGYPIGGEVDTTYPKIDQVLHTKYHLEWYSWFSRGFDSINRPLLDEYFSACPWILFGEPVAWVGYAQPTIDAVSVIPPFVRQFGWSAPPPPPPTATDNAEITVLTTGNTVNVTAINRGTNPWTRANLYRLAASDQNTAKWALSPTQGYSNSVQDQRVFLPRDNVLPGESVTFTFDCSSSGGNVFGAQMIRDGVGLFGNKVTATLPIVIPPPPPPVDYWIDPRCPWVKVKQQGTQYKVTNVFYYAPEPPDNPESKNLVSIIVQVNDKNGKFLNHVPVSFKNGGVAVDYTRVGSISFDQGGNSVFYPDRGEVGPYSIEVGDVIVSGMGLPVARHVEYLIEVVKQT